MKIRITLVPVRSFPGDPIVRLRRALKCLLRSFGLRNVGLEDLEAVEAVRPPSRRKKAKVLSRPGSTFTGTRLPGEVQRWPMAD